ncbi:MAG: exodeoxyribonuclease VII small subunit [Eggerthellaceae bacterium]|nr:exodeoxyribonuclease VII small subunit [Eggerthellaceae bacterium]
MDAQHGTFDEVRARLEQIVDEVNAEGVTLDEALSLYEEAVKLGLSACDMSEQDALEAAEALNEADAEGAADAAGAAQAAGANAGAGADAPVGTGADAKPAEAVARHSEEGFHEE